MLLCSVVHFVWTFKIPFPSILIHPHLSFNPVNFVSHLLCPNYLYTYLFTTMSIINPTTTTASSPQLQGLPPSNNLYGHGAPFMAAATGCRSVATRHPYPSQRRRPVSARLPANQIAAFEQPYARLHDAKAGQQQREAGSGWVMIFWVDWLKERIFIYIHSRRLLLWYYDKKHGWLVGCGLEMGSLSFWWFDIRSCCDFIG